MIISWANSDQTYVRVEVMGTVYEIPTDNAHPDWRNIKAMVDAGTLTISPYVAPTPAED